MAPSPLVLVNNLTPPDGSNSLTADSTVTVALVSGSGVASWSLSVISTDDSAPTIPTITINQSTFTATFTMTGVGTALLMQSIVNNNLDAQGIFHPEYTFQFKCGTLSVDGYQTFALGEQLESGPFGWLPVLNRKYGSDGGGGSFVPGGDLTGVSTDQTVVGLQTIPVSATTPILNQVLQYNGSEYVPATISSSVSLTPVLFSQLTNLSPIGTTQTVNVDGYYTAGDGAGSLFDWNATSTATPDVNTVKVTGITTGRWIRQRIDPSWYSVKWFGAYGDNTHDDTVAIQLALDSVPQMGVLFFPSGSYLLTSPVFMRKWNIVIDAPSGPTFGALTGGATLQWYSGATTADPLYNLWTGPMFVIGPEAISPTNPFTYSKIGNIYCINITNAPDQYNGVPICLSDVDCGIIEGWGTGTPAPGTAKTGFTFECFVNPNGNNPASNQQTIIATSSGRRDIYNSEPANQAFILSILDGYHLLVTLNTTGGGASFHSTNLLPANSLSHIAVTYDQSNLRLFINGVLSDSSACTGTIVQESWEDFTIGYGSLQYVLGEKGYGIVGTMTIGSIRLSSSALYTSNFTAPTTELTCIPGNVTVAIAINFDPQYIMMNGLWIKAYSGMSSITTGRHSNGDPVYLFLGHQANNYAGVWNVFSGAILKNICMSNGATGELIVSYAGNSMNLSNMDLDGCQSCITFLGGYGHTVKNCLLSASNDLQCHSWCIGAIDGAGGILNLIDDCNINGGWYSIFTGGGFNILNCFFNNTPAFCGVGCYSDTEDLGTLNIEQCSWDDEQSGSTDSGIYVTGLDTVTLRNNDFPGSGNSQIPIYKIGGCGYVEITDNLSIVNSSSSGLIQIVSNMIGNAPIILNNTFNLSNALGTGAKSLIDSGSIYTTGDGYSPVVIPTNEISVLTITVISNVNISLFTYQQTFGTIIIIDPSNILTGSIDVIFPFQWANTKKTVVNNTAHTITWIGLSGTGVSSLTDTSNIIYCDGTNWNKIL